jgi:hypothetical protein
MDSKGKGNVTKEKETISINDEPKEEKPVDSGSGKRKSRRRRKSTTTTSTLLPLRTRTPTTSPRQTKRQLNMIISKCILITHVFLIMPMLIYFIFLLACLLTLMGRIIFGGVTK